MSLYDPAWLSRPVFTCQLDFVSDSAKLASKGLDLLRNTTKTTTQQPTSQTANAVFREEDKNRGGNLLLLV